MIWNRRVLLSHALPLSSQRYPVLPLLLALLLASLCLSACKGNETPDTVIVYTSVDQVYSEPILNAFQKETGIQVRAVYDVEAAKTTGLVNRLIAEKDTPQADVFWNGEFAQTLRLKEEGVLTPYESEATELIPPTYRDDEGYWTGFAGRARVLIVNTDEIPLADYPESIFDLADPAWPAERIGVAYPLFGTTSTHAAALYALLGIDEARSFFESLQQQGVRVVDGNSVVRDLVVDGELWMGLTDTDDACAAVHQGAPVDLVFLDQDGLGTLIVPNSVAVIADGPNPDSAQRFVDYLLSNDVQKMLIESGWSHVSLAEKTFDGCTGVQQLKDMDVSLEAIDEQMPQVQSELREMFVR